MAAVTPEHRVAYTMFWFKGPEKGGAEDMTPYDRFKCTLSHTVLNNLASQS